MGNSIADRRLRRFFNNIMQVPDKMLTAAALRRDNFVFAVEELVNNKIPQAICRRRGHKPYIPFGSELEGHLHLEEDEWGKRVYEVTVPCKRCRNHYTVLYVTSPTSWGRTNKTITQRNQLIELSFDIVRECSFDHNFDTTDLRNRLDSFAAIYGMTLPDKVTPED